MLVKLYKNKQMLYFDSTDTSEGNDVNTSRES